MSIKYFYLTVLFLFSSASLYAQKFFESTPVKYTGSVGSNPIEMTLAQTQIDLSGSYFYTKIRQPIQLSSDMGTVDGNYTKIVERVGSNVTGYFFLKDFDIETTSTVYGTWKSPDGKKSFPVVLYRK